MAKTETKTAEAATKSTAPTPHYDPNFDGPVSQRKCRDVFFLLLFFLALVAWGFLGWQAYTFGEPKKLL